MFPMVFHSFYPSCLDEGRRSGVGGKKQEQKFRGPSLPNWSSRVAACQPKGSQELKHHHQIMKYNNIHRLEKETVTQGGTRL